MRGSLFLGTGLGREAGLLSDWGLGGFWETACSAGREERGRKRGGEGRGVGEKQGKGEGEEERGGEETYCGGGEGRGSRDAQCCYSCRQ